MRLDILSVVEVLPEPVILVVEVEGQPVGDLVRKPARQIGVRTDGLVGSDRRRKIAGEIVAGIAGRHLDQAAGGVPPEQCALRPLQDGDLGYVGQIEQRTALRAIINAVDIDRDRVLQAGPARGGADAADARLAETGQLGVEAQPGDHLGEIGGRLNALLLERIAAERGNRDRHVLQTFGPTLCGHDDVGDLPVATIGLGRRGRRLRQQARRGHRAGDDRARAKKRPHQTNGPYLRIAHPSPPI